MSDWMTEEQYDELEPEIKAFAKGLREKGARGVVVYVAFGNEGDDCTGGGTIERDADATDQDPNFLFPMWAMLSFGNADSLIGQMRKYSKEHGHNSVYLQMFDNPVFR